MFIIKSLRFSRTHNSMNKNVYIRTHTQGSVKKVVLYSGALVLVLALCFGIYVIGKRVLVQSGILNTNEQAPAAQDQEPLGAQTQALLLGDAIPVVGQLEDKIDTMTNTSREAIDLKFAYANALFANGVKEDTQDAVVTMRELVEETTYARTRAVAVNTLLWAAYANITNFAADEFPYYLDAEIVSLPGYAEMLSIANDTTNEGFITARHGLMYYLAKWSHEIQPTPFSTLFLANWNSHVLLGTPYRENIAGDTSEELLAQIGGYMEQFDSLFVTEKENAYLLQDSENVSLLFWKGTVLGDVAVAGFTPPQSFEEPFNQALTLIEESQTVDNNIYPNYADFIHFYYAVYLLNTTPEDRQEDIVHHVKLLLSSLEQDTDAEPGSFKAFLDNTRIEYQQGRITPRYQYIVDVATFSPEFKEYLVQNNWEL